MEQRLNPKDLAEVSALATVRRLVKVNMARETEKGGKFRDSGPVAAAA